MPTLPEGAGELPPGAIRAHGPGPHLAQTGHTIQTHWIQPIDTHRHVFTDKATCDICDVHVDVLMAADVEALPPLEM